MSQAPSSSVQVLILEDKLDYLINPLQDFKNSFCLGFLYESLAVLEGKIRMTPFFKVQSSKITVWPSYAVIFKKSFLLLFFSNWYTNQNALVIVAHTFLLNFKVCKLVFDEQDHHVSIYWPQSVICRKYIDFSWKWLIILIPATVWQTLELRRMK